MSTIICIQFVRIRTKEYRDKSTKSNSSVDVSKKRTNNFNLQIARLGKMIQANHKYLKNNNSLFSSYKYYRSRCISPCPNGSICATGCELCVFGVGRDASDCAVVPFQAFHDTSTLDIVACYSPIVVA